MQQQSVLHILQLFPHFSDEVYQMLIRSHFKESFFAQLHTYSRCNFDGLEPDCQAAQVVLHAPDNAMNIHSTLPYTNRIESHLLCVCVPYTFEFTVKL